MKSEEEIREEYDKVKNKVNSAEKDRSAMAKHNTLRWVLERD